MNYRIYTARDGSRLLRVLSVSVDGTRYYVTRPLAEEPRIGDRSHREQVEWLAAGYRPVSDWRGELAIRAARELVG